MRAGELLRLFDELFDETEPKTAEEVDAVLREAGYDPSDIASRMQALGEAVFTKYEQLHGKGNER
jgi:hypothetical protein